MQIPFDINEQHKGINIHNIYTNIIDLITSMSFLNDKKPDTSIFYKNFTFFFGQIKPWKNVGVRALFFKIQFNTCFYKGV
ncbi:hypothetical protein DLD82_01360 [Methanospirillum stamsii]|uniref:Uncharacterized protein n=1 Tax=Methanospirillum stamsii TaxID=1277351 RepID=A0A2V2NIJ0_9EURY|nr:hypothetical protein DLD82_01360 [Methanospirillum stamsii]